MLPRALAADGGGNASIRVSTDGKAGYISTTGDAAHAHKLPKVSRLAILIFSPSRGPVLCSGWPANAGEAAKNRPRNPPKHRCQARVGGVEVKACRLQRMKSSCRAPAESLNLQQKTQQNEELVASTSLQRARAGANGAGRASAHDGSGVGIHRSAASPMLRAFSFKSNLKQLARWPRVPDSRRLDQLQICPIHPPRLLRIIWACRARGSRATASACCSTSIRAA